MDERAARNLGDAGYVFNNTSLEGFLKYQPVMTCSETEIGLIDSCRHPILNERLQVLK